MFFIRFSAVYDYRDGKATSVVERIAMVNNPGCAFVMNISIYREQL